METTLILRRSTNRTVAPKVMRPPRRKHCLHNQPDTLLSISFLTHIFSIIKVYSSNGYLDQAFHFYQRFRSVLIRPRRIPYQAYPKKLNHMKVMRASATTPQITRTLKRMQTYRTNEGFSSITAHQECGASNGRANLRTCERRAYGESSYPVGGVFAESL